MDGKRQLLTACLFAISVLAVVVGIRQKWPPADGASAGDVYARITKIGALLAGLGGLVGVLLIIIG